MRRWHKIAIVAGAIIAGLILAAVWYLHSRAFHDRIQAFIAAQVRQATGAKVSFGQFQISLNPMAVDVRDVVVEGREAPRQPPLATIAHVHARIRLTHWFPPAIQILAASVDHPVLNVYYLPSGGTDLPQPPTPPPPGQPLAEPIFDFGIRHLTITHGVVNVRDRHIPLAAHLSGLETSLVYQAGHYQGVFAFRHGAITVAHRPPLEQSATVRFTLWPNDLRIDALDWRGPGVHLTAHGMVRDLGDPRVTAHYQVQVELAPFARWAEVPVIAGKGQAAGELQWSQRTWQTHGQLRLAQVGLRPPWPALGGLQASGPYRASPRGLFLPALAVAGGGGQGRIQLAVADWRRFSVAGELHGFHLEKLMATSAALGGPQPPAALRALLPPLAGTLSAQIHAAGDIRQLQRLSLTAQVRIQPPPAAPRPAAGPAVLPVNALLTAHAARGQWLVRIPRFQIAAPDLQLHARGRISPVGSQLAFSLAVPHLAAWRPALAPFLPRLALGAFGVPAASWPLTGALHLHGQLSGKLPIGAGPSAASSPRVPRAPQLDLALALTLTGFRLGPLAADQLILQAQVTPQQLALGRMYWRQDGQTVTLSGTVGLHHFLPGAASPLHMTLEARGLQLAAIEGLARRWAHVQLPAIAPRQGQLALDLAITGTPAQPHAAGPISLAGARVDHLPVTTATARITVNRHAVEAGALRVQIGAAQVTGAAGYDWQAGTFRAELRGADISLARIPALQSPQLRLAGTVAFTLQASGPVLHPRGTLHVTARHLEGQGESLGSLDAALTADGHAAHLQASAGLPGGTVRVTAQIGEAAPYPLSASAQFADYDVDALLRRFTPLGLGAGPGRHSRISGRIRVQGPLSDPEALVAQADLGPVELALSGDFTLRNQGPIHIGLAHQVVTLAPAHIVGPETDFTLAGAADLSARGRLSGTANGRVNLHLLHDLDPTVHASGELTLAASLGGTIQKPEVNGSLSVHNASLAQEQLPVAFDDINGELRFTGQHVTIQHLTARTGGGRVAISGFAARTAQGFTAALDARGEGLRVRYKGLSAAGNLDLHLAGNQAEMLLSGNVELTRVALAPNFDFAFFLANQRTAISPPTVNSWLDRIHLQVHVVTGPSVGIAISTARVEFQADLHVRGTLANPVLLGRVSASEGEILFAGQTYKLAKAEVTFANPFRIQPILDVSLTTTVQQYQITLNISGPADRLDITYRSDPPLTTSDIVALLATGQTQEARNFASEQSTTSFAGQSEQLLGRAFESLVSSRLQRIFGVTQIQFNPNAQGFGPTAQTTVTIQQQVRRNLKVTYTQNLTNSVEDIIRVDWTLAPNFGITLSRGQFGLYGISLHFSQRAR